MRLSAFFVTMLCLFAAGCAHHYRDINGVRMEVLSPKEEIELQSMARATLAKAAKLSAGDRQFIKNQTPQLKIRYIGDRTGDATVTWNLPDKYVILRMRGALLDPTAQWMMMIRKKQPELIDFSRRPRQGVEKK